MSGNLATMRSFRLVLSAAAISVLAHQASAEPSSPDDQARQHFAAGVNFLRDPMKPRYEEAYAEFKQSYALSKAPKVLGNLGLCAMMLERDGEAIEAYEKYLPLASEGEKAQLQRDLFTLRVSAVTIQVSSDPPGATLIDTRVPVQGESINNLYGPLTSPLALKIRKGHHILKAKLGNREEVWEVEAAGEQLPPHVFKFEPEAPLADTVSAPKMEAVTEERTRPVPKSVYVGLAVSGALGLGALATGWAASNTRAAFDRANDGFDRDRASDLQSRGQLLNGVTDGLLVGTVVALGVTTVLYLTRPAAPAQTARWTGLAF